MAQDTKIEWAEATWNMIGGCTEVSPACDNCYARAMAWRMMHNPKAPTRYYGTVQDAAGHGRRWTERINLDEAALEEPLHWRKPRRIFVASMADLFHPDVPFEFIAAVYGTMAACSWHTFLVLTKRPERALEFYRWIETQWKRLFYSAEPDIVDANVVLQFVPGEHWDGHNCPTCRGKCHVLKDEAAPPWPLPNVWIGVTAENQPRADERIPVLMDTPAAVRFVSIEPMLAPADISEWTTRAPCRTVGIDCYGGKCEQVKGLKLDWVIAGGETGPGARLMHPDWVRSLRDQCQDAGIPFYLKSWGDWAPDCLCGTPEPHRRKPRPQPGRMGVMYHCGKARAGHLLDGQEWRQFPEVLR